MTNQQTEFTLNLPPADCLSVCLKAVLVDGWQITSQSEKSVRCKKQLHHASSVAEAMEVEINVIGQTSQSSKISFRATNDLIDDTLVAENIEGLVAEITRQLQQFRPARHVLINGVPLTDEQITALEQMYKVAVQNGAYWYDPYCGAWGDQGGPAKGFIHPGLNIGGQLRADASNGNTGVFINGRQLHFMDVMALQQLGPVYPGRYWVDAHGNVGFEGGMAFANLWALSAAAGANRGGPWSAHSSVGTVGGDNNGFLFFQGNDGTFYST